MNRRRLGKSHPGVGKQLNEVGRLLRAFVERSKTIHEASKFVLRRNHDFGFAEFSATKDERGVFHHQPFAFGKVHHGNDGVPLVVVS